MKPAIYHLNYSAQAVPTVITPGEPISISMADAHGYDETMQQVAASPNPLVGPFVIKDAHPGQTLAVTIEALAPNRAQGWANKNIHPNLYMPANRPQPYLKEYVQWEIDLENATARPMDGYFPQGQIVLPVKTVLGCIGVAPDQADAPSSILSGGFGGNMDYARIQSGTTLYLPIFVEGGYLYIGDGHAVQGAGEITGNGIEISCDIRFQVRVDDSRLRFPRGEDSEFLFCMGNTANFENNIRIATEEMETWLGERYRLTKNQCGILMGQLVAYEIGNFVSPITSAACLMPKAALARLGRLPD